MTPDERWDRFYTHCAGIGPRIRKMLAPHLPHDVELAAYVMRKRNVRLSIADLPNPFAPDDPDHLVWERSYRRGFEDQVARNVEHAAFKRKFGMDA